MLLYMSEKNLYVTHCRYIKCLTQIYIYAVYIRRKRISNAQNTDIVWSDYGWIRECSPRNFQRFKYSQALY